MEISEMYCVSYLDSTNTVQFKITHINKKSDIESKMRKNGFNTEKEMRELFEDFDEWEDFDRMKHMTPENREKADKSLEEFKRRNKK